MKQSLLDKLIHLQERLEEINLLLADENAAADMDKYRALTREHAEISPIVAVFSQYTQAKQDLKDAEELLQEPEMKAFAEEEIENAHNKINQLENELQILLLPKDEDDNKNVFLEVRAGTGGDEAALFAGDLLRMYLRYAERCGWKSEIVSANESDLGGYKEVIAR